jgi:starvation-inducible DNA-binding protein
MMEKTKLKTHAKLGFSDSETEEVVNHLNQLLANYNVQYQKLRNFHWNVKGSDFFELHEKFEEQYESSKDNIDEIAERIRVFGKTPMSTMREYLEVSEIEEVGTNLSGEEMVIEFLNDMQILLSLMVDTSDAAQDIGDIGTAGLMNRFIVTLEKTHWMYSSWLNGGKEDIKSRVINS